MEPVKTFLTTAHRGAAAVATIQLATIGCQSKVDASNRQWTDVVILEDFRGTAGALLLLAGERLRYKYGKRNAS
jgi:hypothetical protein